MQNLKASQSYIAQHPIIEIKQMAAAASDIAPAQQGHDKSFERKFLLSQTHKINEMTSHDQHSAIATVEQLHERFSGIAGGEKLNPPAGFCGGLQNLRRVGLLFSHHAHISATA